MAVVTGTSSDSHTWNLVCLQLVMEEVGFSVVNLGPCVPDLLLVDECHRIEPDLIVVSSVNGHGCNDGMRVAPLLRQRAPLRTVPLVIGGKLGIDGVHRAEQREQLRDTGYDHVFDHDELPAFRALLAGLRTRVVS
jgi:methylaspartate mutase sigma subunit